MRPKKCQVCGEELKTNEYMVAYYSKNLQQWNIAHIENIGSDISFGVDDLEWKGRIICFSSLKWQRET